MTLVELETSEARVEPGDVSAPADPSGVVGGPSELDPDTSVEVRARFDQRWSPGFTVIGHDDAGYRIRRQSDGAELPTRFTRDELRRERHRGQWWY